MTVTARGSDLGEKKVLKPINKKNGKKRGIEGRKKHPQDHIACPPSEREGIRSSILGKDS